MTKTDLITAINTQLTAIITQAKVRLASLQLVNELFPIEIQETYSGITDIRNITEPTIEDNFYNLRFYKQGNNVKIIGVLINKQTNITSGIKFFKLTNSEFYQKSSLLYINEMIGISSINLDNKTVKFNYNNELICDSVLGVGENININISYQTND